GDIDCFVSGGRDPVIYFENRLDNLNFIKIKPVGVKSNRSAIGAKTLLYRAGHLDEKEHLLGLREVSSGNGLGGMPSRSIHYGADVNKKYDLRIIFPSGINRVFREITPGKSLTVYEITGFSRTVTRTGQFINHFFRNRDRQQDMAIAATMAALILLFTLFVINRQKMRPINMIYLFLFPLLTFVAAKIIFVTKHMLYQNSLSITASFFAFIITLLFVQEKKTVLSKERWLEELNLVCRNFDHGNWAASYLNQIQLYCTNLSGEKSIAASIIEDFKTIIIEFYDQVYKEIKKIIQLTANAGIERYKANSLDRNLVNLSDNLNKIKLKLALGQEVPKNFWINCFRSVDRIQSDIKIISKAAAKYFQVDLIALLKISINRFVQKNSCQIEFTKSTSSNKILVSGQVAALCSIFENLFTNACEALGDKELKKIAVSLNIEHQHAIVRLSDKGKGIAPAKWEQLFQPNFTSKPDGKGGFGLYFARQTIEKFGGAITVEQSSLNSGTTFLLKFPVIAD
ncbi:MAG: ATP-binding protein, partial [bacterium]|nr:ATP-binding protein [bacterium]